MAVSRAFKIALGVALAVTLGAKALISQNVRNPSNIEIAERMAPFFAERGFQIAGRTGVAGRDALLVARDACLIYVVPVAHQGWHQATVRQAVRPPQKLWFAFEGRLTANEQERWRPILVYYVHKALRHVGIDLPFPPVLALVTDGDCGIESLPWDRLPPIGFRVSGD